MRTEPTTPQIGEDAEFQACGKTWKLGRLDVEVWDALLEWAKPRIINPLEYLRVIAKDIPQEVLMKQISEGRDKCPFILTILHPMFQECINETPEGNLQQFYLLLRKHHPEVTRDEALAVLKELGEAKQQELIGRAAGKNKPAKKSEGRAARHPNRAEANGAEQLAGDSEFSLAGVSLIAAPSA